MLTNVCVFATASQARAHGVTEINLIWNSVFLGFFVFLWEFFVFFVFCLLGPLVFVVPWSSGLAVLWSRSPVVFWSSVPWV